jgi:hypothetical protein
MLYNNSGPIYSVLTSKSPCGVYGGVELDGSTVDGVVLNAANCTGGKLGPFCRGGVNSGWCCFGPCMGTDSSDCPNGKNCNGSGPSDFGNCCGPCVDPENKMGYVDLKCLDGDFWIYSRSRGCENCVYADEIDPKPVPPCGPANANEIYSFRVRCIMPS